MQSYINPEPLAAMSYHASTLGGSNSRLGFENRSSYLLFSGYGQALLRGRPLNPAQGASPHAGMHGRHMHKRAEVNKTIGSIAASRYCGAQTNAWVILRLVPFREVVARCVELTWFQCLRTTQRQMVRNAAGTYDLCMATSGCFPAHSTEVFTYIAHGNDNQAHAWCPSANSPSTSLRPNEKMTAMVVSPTLCRPYFSSNLNVPSKEQWEARRPMISDSYIDRRHTAKQILMELKKQGFNVTEKMLRDKLSRWGLRKKTSAALRHENTAILSWIQANSQGTPSIMFETPSSSFSSANTTTSGTPQESSVSPLLLTPSPNSPRGSANAQGEVFVPRGEVYAVLPAEGMNIPRPMSTPCEEVPRRQALRSVVDWFDAFREAAQTKPWDFRDCPMRNLMVTLQDACYLLDTGSLAQGNAILGEIPTSARLALCSPHPAAFIHLLQGLNNKRLATRQLQPSAMRPQRFELAVMLNERQRVIECDGCDISIKGLHYHCKTCTGPCFDLCQRCFASGARCSNNDHSLVVRTIQDGTVTEVPEGVSLPTIKIYDSTIRESSEADKYSGKPLIYATTTATSCVPFQAVCRLLLSCAQEDLGLRHPMTLLLTMFQTSADLIAMQRCIAAIMDENFLGHIQGGSTHARSSQYEIVCGWILLQQGRHQTLKTLLARSKLSTSFDTMAFAELMRLLAISETEQGRLFEAGYWLLEAYGLLDTPDHSQSYLMLKILQDLAYVHWQTEDTIKCEEALDLAWSIIQHHRSPSKRDWKYILTLRNTVMLRLRKNNEAAALRAAHPDVFDT